MDLVDMRLKGLSVLISHFAKRILGRRQELRFLDQLGLQVVNILSHKHQFFPLCLHAVLLKLQNLSVSLVWLLFTCKLDKVSVPFPDCHRILLEKDLRQNLGRIGQTSVLFPLGPESQIITFESRDAAAATEPSSSQNRDFALTSHEFCSLCCSLLLHLIGVLIGFLKSASKEESHAFHELCINVRELLFHLLDLKLQFIDNIPRVQHLDSSAGAFSLASCFSIFS